MTISGFGPESDKDCAPARHLGSRKPRTIGIYSETESALGEKLEIEVDWNLFPRRFPTTQTTGVTRQNNSVTQQDHFFNTILS